MKKQTTKTKITGNTTLAEALALPKGAEILIKHHVPCPTCPMMALEAGSLALNRICKIYGLDLPALLKDLNQSAVQKSLEPASKKQNG